ncbi:MAG: hypothetical protein LRY71_06080 [Bacillaceae bacterium]|nr:hypothetical protein [Bacillaceae bacterium]
MKKSVTQSVLLIAILWGGFQSLYFIGLETELLLSDIILEFGFSLVEFILVSIIDLSIKFLPFILFQIVFGTYIYQHFCSASVFYFSRCPNRIKWFVIESVKLYMIAFIYPLLMVVSATGMASITNHIIFDGTSFLLLFYYVLIHSIWLFLTALLINVISITLDSSFGFIIVVSLQLACVSLLLLWENVWPLADSPDVVRHVLLLKFNPISHLILSWHSSSFTELNDRLNYFQIDFSLNTSVVVFFVNECCSCRIWRLCCEKSRMDYSPSRKVGFLNVASEKY